MLKQFEMYEQLRQATMVSVKIDHGEAIKLVIKDLIKKRNCPQNKIVDAFDAVLRYYITEDEFQAYVINGESLD